MLALPPTGQPSNDNQWSSPGRWEYPNLAPLPFVWLTAHNSPAHAGEDVYAHRIDSPREKKAARILDVLRIAPAAPEGMLMSRTVDEAAPDLDALSAFLATPEGARYIAFQLVLPIAADRPLTRDLPSARRALHIDSRRICCHPVATISQSPGLR